MGIIVMLGIGVMAVSMAHFENTALDLIGYTIMTAIAVGCIWHVANTINSTFFF